MPVKRRQQSSTGFYHIIVKGINKEKIFNQQRERIYFKKIILKHLEKYEVEIHAYCIMSNHAHFIIRAQIQVLSLFMAVILAEYALYYNFKHHRNGHVFQNRFKSECIETEQYYWNCLRYIHLNPVKANMIKIPERYKYSSMGEYMLETPFLVHETAIETYKKNFENFEKFKVFHKQKAQSIFEDITEEKQSQQREIAMILAEEILQRYQLPLLNQVFEEKNMREEYIKKLRKILKITEAKAKKLCIFTWKCVETE